MALTHEQFVEALTRDSVERWSSPVPDGPLPTRAVMTIVHDESFFFPIWLDYYSRFFGPEHIFVLDHDTTDGSTDGDGFTRIPVTHDGVDHRWMRDTVQALQHELLDDHDVVLFTDVDEIIALDPAFGDLGDAIDRMREPFLHCTGMEIIHRPAIEAPYDPNRGIFEQRGHWFANGSYNKPLLATEPLHWIPGFHGLDDDGSIRLDPNLYLVHLHRLDFEVCRRRHALRSTRRWNERDLRDGYAAHNLLVDGQRFETWFDTSNAVDDIPIVIEQIPDHWKDVL